MTTTMISHSDMVANLRPALGLAVVAPSPHVLLLLAVALALAVASASTSAARRARRPSRRARREESSPRPPRGGSLPGDPQPAGDEDAARWDMSTVLL